VSDIVWTSVTRRVRSGPGPLSFAPLDREGWDDGHVVVCEATGAAGHGTVEQAAGRIVEVVPGDLIAGALGVRRATLEVVGDHRDVGADLALATLTRGGVLGAITAASRQARPYVVNLAYRGHLRAAGAPVRLRDIALSEPAVEPALPPTVLLVGSSMSAGKTTAARAIIRVLRAQGRHVAGVKLTGVGRYHDVLSMRDAGARAIFDFVDGGLPSTVADADEVAGCCRRVLGAVAAAEPDVLVAEVGASPLEPYRSEVAIALLQEATRLVVLCASDPYAASGVIEAFGLTPDLIAGRATSTPAGIALAEALTGCPAVDVTDPASRPALAAALSGALGLQERTPSEAVTGPG
jgi:hypothetical protein